MSKELKLFSGNTLAELKEGLTTLSVTKALAVKWLNLKALVTGKDGEAVTKACNEHLMNCKDCEEVYEDGFGVKLIQQTKKIYKPTKGIANAQKEIDDLNAALKIAKKKLELEQEIAGFDEEPGLAYYKAV